MKKETALNIITFLNRTDLKGTEAQAFVEAIQAIELSVDKVEEIKQ